MNSDRRHEWEHNSLDTELSKGVSFLKQQGTRILWAILVVAAVILAYTYWTRSTQQATMDVQTRLKNVQLQMLDTNADPNVIAAELKSLSEQDTLEWVAAQALLLQGNLSLNQGLAAADAGAKTQALKAAEGHYQAAAAKSQEASLPSLQALALLGQGRLAEIRGDLDQAKAAYEKGLAIANLKGYPAESQLQTAVANLKLATKPVQLPTSQPAWITAKELAEKVKAEEEQAENEKAEAPPTLPALDVKPAETKTATPAATPAPAPTPAPTPTPAPAPAPAPK